ncbi:50S ribosomal protein L29 [Brasilonema sp. CT11]|nr:50S ribosomal protein L29 [Brasilonema sp. CT11]
MPLPKISEAREFSDEQLGQEITAVKKELFQLRLQQATRQLDKPHLFRHARHRLAQLMTVEGERKRASSSQPAKESN